VSDNPLQEPPSAAYKKVSENENRTPETEAQGREAVDSTIIA